ncbi:MAG: DUF4129 domain-containing protein [Gammaproteobacteria bacterium]
MLSVIRVHTRTEPHLWRLNRQASEGLLDYAARISRIHPDMAEHVNTITSLYTNLRYAGMDGVQEFTSLVRALKP